MKILKKEKKNKDERILQQILSLDKRIFLANLYHLKEQTERERRRERARSKWEGNECGTRGCHFC